MVQSELSSISYVGNESTTIPYPIPFTFHVDEDLVVSTVDAAGGQTLLALNTDYTVVGKGNPNGGSLKTTAPVTITSKLTIERIVPITQLVSYQEGDAFPAKSHEGALDKLTEICQQIQRIVGTGTGLPSDIGTAFRLTSTSGGINAVVKVNDSMLGIDVNGNAILRDAGDLLGWLGAAGTYWQNNSERLVSKPAFTGQVGVQLDNWTIYIAHSTNPGDWVPHLRVSGLVTSTGGVPGAMAIPAGDIVGTTESQVLTNKTLLAPTITDPTGLDKNDVGLGNVDNTPDTAKPVSAPVASALSLKQDTAQKGFASGYASLDESGKVPVAQIPDAVLGASQYQGTWNAATNTPAIPAANIGNKGWYYSVGVAGTTTIDGISSWAVGDQIISNGAVWQKIVNVSAVSSVNSKTGAVVINKADVGLSNVDNTSDATKNTAAATLTNKTIVGANQALMQVRLDADVINNLPVARLNNGTGAAPDTWWCGDESWKKPPGTGDVNGPVASADSDIALFNGATGKIIKSAGRNLSGYVDGPASAIADHIPQFSGTTGKLLKDGKAAPAGEIVGTTDTQVMSSKTLDDPTIRPAADTPLYRPSGVIFVKRTDGNTTIPANTWTDLAIFTLPANLMGRYCDIVRMTAMVRHLSVGTHTKVLAIKWNGVDVYSGSRAQAGPASWQIIITILRNNDGTQRAEAQTSSNLSTLMDTPTSLTANLAAPVEFKVMGHSTVASDLYHIMTFVEFLPAPLVVG